MQRIDKDHRLSSVHSESGSAFAIVTIFLFIVLAAACTLGLLVYRQHQTKLDRLLTDQQRLEMRMMNVERITESWGKKVLLTNPGVQKVDTVFLVSKIKAEKYLTGIKIHALMINSSSLEHKDARFRITVNNKSREFAISKISPGSSTKFVVEIPDISLENAEEADIKTLASSVSYFVD